MLLARKDRTLDNVIRVLVEYRDNIGDSAPTTGPAEGAEASVNEAAEKKEILTALIEYLRSLE